MARQGGWRARRYVIPGDVPVWVSSGRWGPRRAHVGESAAILAAEIGYGQMDSCGTRFGPGARASLTWTPDAASNTLWNIEAPKCGRMRCGDAAGCFFGAQPAGDARRGSTCRSRVSSRGGGGVGAELHVSVVELQTGRIIRAGPGTGRDCDDGGAARRTTASGSSTLRGAAAVSSGSRQPRYGELKPGPRDGTESCARGHRGGGDASSLAILIRHIYRRRARGSAHGVWFTCDPYAPIACAA